MCPSCTNLRWAVSQVGLPGLSLHSLLLFFFFVFFWRLRCFFLQERPVTLRDLHIQPLHGDGERQQLSGSCCFPRPDWWRWILPCITTSVRIWGAVLTLVLLFIWCLGDRLIVCVWNTTLSSWQLPSRWLLSVWWLHSCILLLTDWAAGAPASFLNSDVGLFAGRGFVRIRVNVDEGVVVDSLLPCHQEGIFSMAHTHFPLSTLTLRNRLQKLEMKK